MSKAKHQVAKALALVPGGIPSHSIEGGVQRLAPHDGGGSPPGWSFGESLNSTYLFPSVSRLRFFPSASTRYTSPSRRTKTIVLPSGVNCGTKHSGWSGVSSTGLPSGQRGEQEPVAPRGAGEHHAVVRRAEPRHVGVAEVRGDERGGRAVRVGDHHPAARAVVNGEDHLCAVRGEGVAERLLHRRTGRPPLSCFVSCSGGVRLVTPVPSHLQR